MRATPSGLFLKWFFIVHQKLQITLAKRKKCRYNKTKLITVNDMVPHKGRIGNQVKVLSEPITVSGSDRQVPLKGKASVYVNP